MKRTIATLLAWAAGIAASQASLYIINSTTRGWYRNDGAQNPTGNYISGNYAGSYYRDYFVFDLSAIPLGEVIDSAALRLMGPQINSGDATETYMNFSLDLTSIATLTQYHNPSPESAMIFSDLGDGTAYGPGTNITAGSPSPVDVTLNTAFMNYAQGNLGGSVALGGALTSLDANDGTNEHVFGFGGANPIETRLIITTVPEPSPAVLGVVAALIGLSARKRTRNPG